MRVLVFGSDGFLGKHICEVLSKEHEVFKVSRDKTKVTPSVLYADLLDLESTIGVLRLSKPNVVINSAGIVENSEAADVNPVFSKNLIEAIAISKIELKKIVISGSAAEYGKVDKKNIPVNERTPLNADQGYGLSKLKETSTALELGTKYNLPVVIARIFNPIGVGMHQKFLIPRIINQVREVKDGNRESIEISRLDALRDYVHVNDVALGIKVIIENVTRDNVYNIGSGVATSNGKLVELVLRNSNLASLPNIVETSSEPEPLVAVQADIARMHNEFGWNPVYTLEQTIKEIVNDSAE